VTTIDVEQGVGQYGCADPEGDQAEDTSSCSASTGQTTAKAALASLLYGALQPLHVLSWVLCHLDSSQQS